MQEIHILISILILMNFVFFSLGYIIAKLNSQQIVQSQPKSFFDKNKVEETSSKISIDERKHVVDINTSGLEKKYETLGETKKSDENIESSINKLKNLKR